MESVLSIFNTNKILTYFGEGKNFLKDIKSCIQMFFDIKKGYKVNCNLLIFLVGARGFEPPTP